MRFFGILEIYQYMLRSVFISTLHQWFNIDVGNKAKKCGGSNTITRAFCRDDFYRSCMLPYPKKKLTFNTQSSIARNFQPCMNSTQPCRNEQRSVRYLRKLFFFISIRFYPDYVQTWNHWLLVLRVGNLWRKSTVSIVQYFIWRFFQKNDIISKKCLSGIGVWKLTWTTQGGGIMVRPP